MQVGFEISGEDEQDIQVGDVNSVIHEHWTDELGEYFFTSWTRFCLIYGIFSSMRDLILSLF